MVPDTRIFLQVPKGLASLFVCAVAVGLLMNINSLAACQGTRYIVILSIVCADIVLCISTSTRSSSTIEYLLSIIHTSTYTLCDTIRWWKTKHKNTKTRLALRARAPLPLYIRATSRSTKCHNLTSFAIIHIIISACFFRPSPLLSSPFFLSLLASSINSSTAVPFWGQSSQTMKYK